MTPSSRLRLVLLSSAIALSCLLASCGSGGPDGHDDFPIINRQPQNVTAAVGAKAGFAVAADGGRLHYSWLRNGQPVTTADDTSVYTFIVSGDDQGAKYSVIVKNDAGQVTSNTAILTLLPTTAQADFQSVMLSGGEYNFEWNLNPTGAQVSPADYFAYQQTSLAAAPLGGAAVPVVIAVGNMTSSLAIPESGQERYLVNGQFVYTSTYPDLAANFSLVDGGVQFDEIGTAYNSAGVSVGNVTAYSDFRTNISLTPLTGLISATPETFTDYYNFFGISGIFQSGASWQANSAYLQFTQEAVADRYSVVDCAGSMTTRTPVPTPCLLNQTSLTATMTAGIYDPSQGFIEFSDDGTYVLIGGVNTWVSSVPLLGAPGLTTRYRTYSFIPSQTSNGVTYLNAVFEGVLVKAGTVYSGTYSVATGINAPYQLRLNQAAQQSMKAALTF